MLLRCYIQYASKFGKLNSGQRIGKDQSTSQSQRRAAPKNVPATVQLLKILQGRLQQYVDRELPEVEAGFRRGRGTRDQIANMCWITEKAREFQKNIYFCFIDYAKAFDCVDHSKLWQVLKEMRVPDHLIYLLRNLYV